MKARNWTVRQQDTGKTLREVVAGILRLSAARAAEMVRRGQVRIDGRLCRKPQQSLRPGQRLILGALPETPPTPRRKSPPSARAEKARGDKPRGEKSRGKKTRAAAHGIRVVHQDDDVIVLEKPAGLTTVRHADELAEAGSRAQRFLPPTLVDLVPRVISGPTQGRFRVRAVHRLDRDTSGLVVLARNAEAESHLGQQFRAHSIERRYLALVRGTARAQRIESHLVRDRGDGRRGSGSPETGQRAVTHIRVVETWPGFSLVECRLETGRTHQVRIHLGEAGTPLCGERVYDRPLHGKPVPDTSGARRPMLHAASLAIDHPRSGKRLSWTSEPPEDFDKMQRRFRSGPRGESSSPGSDSGGE